MSQEDHGGDGEKAVKPEEIIEYFNALGPQDSVAAMLLIARLLVIVVERLDDISSNVIDVENLLDRRTR